MLLEELSTKQTANHTHIRYMITRIKHVLDYGKYKLALEGKDTAVKSNAFNIKHFKKVLQRDAAVIGDNFDIELLQSMQVINAAEPHVRYKAFVSEHDALKVLCGAAAQVWVNDCARDGTDIILFEGIISHMIVIHMQPDKHIMTICNTGAGIQFHPSARKTDMDSNEKDPLSDHADDDLLDNNQRNKAAVAMGQRRQLVAQIDHVSNELHVTHHPTYARTRCEPNGSIFLLQNYVN